MKRLFIILLVIIAFFVINCCASKLPACSTYDTDVKKFKHKSKEINGNYLFYKK